MNKIKVSCAAIVVAKNEETRIEACLRALAFCTELIVVDNVSTDKTAVIAARMGAKVIVSQFSDFAKLHNLGAKQAQSDWLLYVDADELVSSQLKDSILGALKGDKSGYRVERKNYYLGKQWPKTEHLIRLMRRNALIGWQGVLHETAIIKGDIGVLEGYLVHDTHRTLTEMVIKTNQWSEAEARLRLEAGHPPIAPWRLGRVFFTGLFRTYFYEGGWKAGVVGVIESMYQGFSLFITYAKLWELQQKK